jgi:hypothetical protein
MATTIRPVRVNHMNVVLENFDASVAHFQKVYGAEFVVDIPHASMHACLVETGRVIFELFFPNEFLLASRYGPHYLGVEYQADMEVVREAVAERGMRIVRDIDVALHTHPADGFGMSFEFYSGYFHDMDWPLLGGPIKKADYWLEQPLGLTGQKGYTLAVHDLDAASAFLQSFVGAEPVYETARPNAGAHAIGLKVGDAVIEVIAPTGDGLIRDHLFKHGQGIRSTLFGVRDLDQARRHLSTQGVEMIQGVAQDTLAVPAEANIGLIFEFSE